MSFHLQLVAFMAFERLRIFDGPGPLIVVCDKQNLVTFYFDCTFDAVERTLGSLIFLCRFLG